MKNPGGRRFAPPQATAALVAELRSVVGTRDTVVVVVDSRARRDGRSETSGDALSECRRALEGFDVAVETVQRTSVLSVLMQGALGIDRGVVFLASDVGIVLVEAPEDLDIQLSAAADYVKSAIARRWLTAIGVNAKSAVVTDRFENGADSLGIALIRVDGQDIIAKSGPSWVIEPEFRFIGVVNDELMSAGEMPLFPRQIGLVQTGDLGVNLMEAVRPETLDFELFTDSKQETLSENWWSALAPAVGAVTCLYRSTLRPSGSQMAQYAYLDRFENVIGDEGFVRAFKTFFGEAHVDWLLRKPIVTPTGQILGGFYQQLEWLERAQDDLRPSYSSLIHGDLHLKNMLRRADGTAVLVDPRTVWDGIRNSDEGFGDPAYDFATLLHSITPMSAILRQVEDTTEGRGTIELSAEMGSLDATGVFPWGGNHLVAAVEDKFVEEILALEPAGSSAASARGRLFVGAANALFGWLKYERALKSQDAWISTYVHSMFYLDRARGVLDISTSQDSPSNKSGEK